MTKIQDLLDGITRFLNGSDHSNTPQIRKLANLYHDACRQLNAQLAECRRLIDQGLLLDAQKLNREARPPLSERARKLTLPPPAKAQFDELCRLYGYPVAPAIDMAVPELLTNPPAATGQLLAKLVLRWRKIARDGKNIDKIKLLREIIQAAPGSDQVWRTNLRHVEQQWVAELLREANLALEARDGARLNALYSALTDPELEQALPEAELEKFRPFLKQYQRSELQRQLDAALDAIAAAYSALDPELTAERLSQFEILASNPLYEPTADVRRQLAEVREYLRNQQEADRRQREFKEKSAALVAELDRHGDFAVIENLYEALRQLDLPMDAKLDLRVANRRDEYQTEARRRHTRKCVYGILLAGLLLAAGALTVTILQRYNTYRACRQTMNEQLEAGNYEAVVKLYTQIAAENPLLLQFGSLTGLKLEAERRQAERQDKNQKFDALLTELTRLLAAPSPAFAEMKRRLDDLNALAPDRQPPESLARYRNAQTAYRQLLQEQQRQRDLAFTEKLSRTVGALDACAAELKQATGDPVLLQRRVEQAAAAAEQILQSQAAGVSPELLKSQQELLKLRCETLRGGLSDAIRRQRLFAGLNRPHSFNEYTDALDQLPTAAPDAASGVWQTALRRLPTVRTLAAAAGFGSHWRNREQFQQRVAEVQKAVRSTPFQEDVERLLPIPFYAENAKQMLDAMNREWSRVYDCYELAFSDAGGRRYSFYSVETPRREVRSNSRIPKSFALDVMLKPGEEGVFLPIRILKDADGTEFFRPGALDGIALPETFTRLHNMNLTDAQFPKAEHHLFLSRALRELRNPPSPAGLEKNVLELLEELQKADTMNPFARAALTRRLLDFLSQTSSFYPAAVEAACVKLDRVAMTHYANWYVPTEQVEFAAEVDALRNFFAAWDVNRLRQYRDWEERLHKLALERGLTPGGILRSDAAGKPAVHWFDGMEHATELWFHTQDAANGHDGFMVLDRQELKADGVLPLAPWSKNLAPGTVFFTPFDGRNTAALAAEALADGEKFGIGNPDWPHSWPINRR